MRRRVGSYRGSDLVEDEYKAGDYNVICDRTGGKYKRSECRFTWDGLLVHKAVWEPRQQQDFLTGTRADRQTVKDARPDNYSTITQNTTLSTDL